MVRIFLLLSLITIGVQCQQLKGRNFVVSIILETPYTMFRDSPHPLTGNDRFEGYIVDLIDAISKRLDFNYILQLNTAGMYGRLLENGSWNGMIGDVVDGRSDFAAGAMTITAEREGAIDFSVPLMSLGIGIVYQKRTYMPRGVLDHFIDLFHPFGFYSTDLFLLLTLVFGIILLLLRRKYKTILFRMLLGLWLLLLFIFAALYAAQLTSHYVALNTYDKKTVPFASVRDVASQNKVEYGCIKGGATESFFRNSPSPLYKKMWSHMLTTIPSPLVSSSAEGMERVVKGGGKYAFIAESTAIEYMTSRYCSLYQVGGLIDSKGFGLAFPQRSPIRDVMNTAILSLQEEGVLSELKHKWWHERNGGGACLI